MTVEIYSQRKPVWAGDHLGLPQASRLSTIGDYGCAITAVAQKLTMAGRTTTPPEVQASLLAAGAFWGDTHNLVNWAAVPSIFPMLDYNGRHDKRPIERALSKAVIRQIDDRLDHGNTVIAYVDASRYAGGLQQHFVLITGRSEMGGYYIANPWNGQAQTFKAYGDMDEVAICGVVWLDTMNSADTDPLPRRIITAEPRLRVRKEPNAAAAIVGYVLHGAIVITLTERDGWGLISDPVPGWITLKWTQLAPTI